MELNLNTTNENKISNLSEELKMMLPFVKTEEPA